MVEVVIEVGLRLHETEGDALVQFEKRLALSPPLDLETVRQLGERLLEVAHPQGHVLERAAFPRSFRREERQLSAARVGADERERVGAVDDVHPEMTDGEVRQVLAGVREISVRTLSLRSIFIAIAKLAQEQSR